MFRIVLGNIRLFVRINSLQAHLPMQAGNVLVIDYNPLIFKSYCHSGNPVKWFTFVDFLHLVLNLCVKLLPVAFCVRRVIVARMRHTQKRKLTIYT